MHVLYTCYTRVNVFISENFLVFLDNDVKSYVLEYPISFTFGLPGRSAYQRASKPNKPNKETV